MVLLHVYNLLNCAVHQLDQGKDYKLVSLATLFLGDCCGAHDAMNDIIMMQELVNHPEINIEASAFVESSKTVVEMFENIKVRLRRVDIQREYQGLKTQEKIGISDDLIGRLASSGIAVEDLTSAMRSGDPGAVHELLSEKLKRPTRLN
ncbi:uncharacterized protein LOC107046012 [Diachasma alloeum]|uniref:uncharacterized protein LOC107046012 n=1 Tax=Diachasma alloeum TaxID=454923 RepID=UPI00073848F7|nr:uncharacterized protein LOC107046012 [Diachasma alloeum]